MEHLEESIVIDRPIEDVFATVTDVGNHKHWTPDMIEARITSEPPIGVGTRYIYDTRFLGKRLQTAGEVDLFERPYSYHWTATSSPFPLSGGFTFERVANGTRVTQYSDSEPGGFFRLAMPILRRNAAKTYPETLRRMKAYIEGIS